MNLDLKIMEAVARADLFLTQNRLTLLVIVAMFIIILLACGTRGRR